MGNYFEKLFGQLRKTVYLFDEKSNIGKYNLLKHLSLVKHPLNNSFILYYDLLLYICAYPADESLLTTAEYELTGISKLLKRKENRFLKKFNNTGLPYTNTITRFSHDLLKWTSQNTDCKSELLSFDSSPLQLNSVMRLTLPSLEREVTTIGLANFDLMKTLLIKEKDQLKFLLSELERYDHYPLLKDYLFDSLDMNIRIYSLNETFSRGRNRFRNRNIFFHNEILKNFDHVALLKKKLPRQEKLNARDKTDLIHVIKNSLTLTGRETDPSTYLDKNSLRFYNLERGVSVAIYGMVPGRQLPLESYVGFTLFKNGFPAAYGGGWVFGKRSMFGINIFESFRGGESGYMMCQLLRVYRHVFNINYFEVEPYQYGAENPEGIESGAFWFYYRFGFRPLNKELARLAAKEYQKLKTKKGSRTDKKILLKFTEENMGLKMEKEIPPRVSDITSKITKLIQRKYDGDRMLAEKESHKNFTRGLSGKTRFNRIENRVLKESALVTESLKITSPQLKDLLIKMIKTKPVDVYKYQELLIIFLKKISAQI